VPAKFVCKHRNLPQLQPARLTSLRTRLRPNDSQISARAAMVTSQWTDMQTAARLAYVVSRQQELRRQQMQTVQAVYVVRTPTGWLIIQI